MVAQKLLAQARAVGLSREEVAEILGRFGGVVLELAISALREGFNKEMLFKWLGRLSDILNNVSPVPVFGDKSLRKDLPVSPYEIGHEPIIQGEQVDSFDDSDIELLVPLLVKVLPAVLANPVVMKLITDAVVKALPPK